jgi:hypothetical protein
MRCNQCPCCSFSPRLCFGINNSATAHQTSHSFPFLQETLRGVAFGGVMLASSALNNLFLTYHLNLFITVVHLQPSHFYVAQLIFMVWNASNDVIFGWFSDNLPVAWGSRRSRLPVIRIGGALWALVFLFAWFPWAGLKVGHSGILINSDRNTRFEANSNSSSYKPMAQKPMLGVEVGKGRLCGLLSR